MIRLIKGPDGTGQSADFPDPARPADVPEISTRKQGSPAGKYTRCTIVLNDGSEVLVSMRADLTVAVQGQGQGRWDAGDALYLNESAY